MNFEWCSRGWLMILHLWRGGYSLGMSFWAFGIVGLLLINSLIAGLFKLIDDPSLFLVLAMGALGLAYQVWVTVGIWRSAGKHPGMGLYAFGARMAIVILGVYSIALLSLATMMLMLGGAVLLNPPFIK
jgi:hypothetical protein